MLLSMPVAGILKPFGNRVRWSQLPKHGAEGLVACAIRPRTPCDSSTTMLHDHIDMVPDTVCKTALTFSHADPLQVPCKVSNFFNSAGTQSRVSVSSTLFLLILQTIPMKLFLLLLAGPPLHSTDIWTSSQLMLVVAHFVVFHARSFALVLYLVLPQLDLTRLRLDFCQLRLDSSRLQGKLELRVATSTQLSTQVDFWVGDTVMYWSSKLGLMLLTI